jgi:hypothetical protein
LAQHQHTGRIAIQAMNELQERRVRPGRAQLLHHAMAYTAAAVHGDPGGLVDNDEHLVFMDYFGLQRRRGAPRRGARAGAHRGYAQAIPLLQAIFRPHPAAVHPHFAAAQDAVDMALRHPFQPLRQVVVDALAGRFGPHLMPRCEIFT